MWLNPRMRRNMNREQALAMFHEIAEEDSDGGEVALEEFSDSGSDSDYEPPPPKRRAPPSVQSAEPSQPLPERGARQHPPPVPTQSSPAVSANRPAVAEGSGSDSSNSAEPQVPNEPWRETAKDGTIWTLLQPGRRPGRRQVQNVVTEAAGPTPHAKRNIDTKLSAFQCIFDRSMLHHIRDCSVAEAHRAGDTDWDMSVEELKAFIALLYVRGTFNKNVEMESLWSNEWGMAFFPSTMSRQRYREIMRYLRFDNKNDRQARLQNDKFALISKVWDQFVANCVACYKAGAFVTVDKQLFPSKTRCPFTQFMPNKPDKFGIKFWVAADVETKYMLNITPYLGKEESRPRDVRLGESVVMKLLEPMLGKGRNVTTDSYFTSLSLARRLLEKQTSIVGTMNRAKRELPPSTKQAQREFDTKIFAADRTTLTIYQCKTTESVAILSTLHHDVAIGTDRKRMPETILLYNSTKVAVDVLDQMARLYSVKGATRRWPVAVFSNMLDLATVNAHVLYKGCTGENISRRSFILELAKELRADLMAAKQPTLTRIPEAEQQPLPKKRQCQVNTGCKKNMTWYTCAKCSKPTCGKCAVKVSHVCHSCA
ncbi:hypothetical protein GJAV_G00071830 [Gymnothorax javanicus]|nr:hypothetical protein GJAV_G00071830 [Gymnothorax javanicus]